MERVEKTRHAILRESEVDIFGEETDSDEDFVLSETEVESEEDGLDYDDDYECSPKKACAEEEVEQQPSTSADGPRQYLYGKDNYKWLTKAPESRDRKSIPIYLPGCKQEAREMRTPLEMWSLLFSDELLEIIVKHTNEEINRRLINLSSQSYYRKTDLIEIKAFIGLLYFAGLQKDRDKSTINMWKENGCSMYRAVMTRNRFIFLSSCLRFDDKTTRKDRQTTDRLTAIREIWDEFIKNCTKYYIPSQSCTIGEQLLGFKGKFFAKVYIKGEPDKYGIKILCLNDSKTFYMLNAIPYTGKVATERLESVPSYYVRQLSTPIHGTGKNITCNNWFTSIESINMIKHEYSLTMVGTIRKNKRQIPLVFRRSASVGNARYVYRNDMTLLSYTPKKNKVVCLVSSLHKNKGKTDLATQKPEIVSYYNSTKGGTDTFDFLCKSYSTCRKTTRWTIRLFFSMLDQAVVNSNILYNLNDINNVTERYNFIENLAIMLAGPYMQNRLQHATIQNRLKISICAILQIEEPQSEKRKHKLEKRKRCYYCKSTLNRKTWICCFMCGKPIS
ncbi:PREDICTED: piggyBac transposable element-derived protein 3-like [Cyphomyrmex costatus]|uniref:piggyBac transposable element-derived protein 3-like n=1 Tax=Cyphomyrmex costatus TaxID=456900 RepID=UPI000852210A|nr:PREDICTED: piggyBac transposable element-derived protein 3-like [Cyphomyrmex costatus]